MPRRNSRIKQSFVHADNTDEFPNWITLEAGDVSISQHADSNLTQADLAVQSAMDGLENKFLDLQRQIDALQRLASLGTACAMIAHEFNNVLTPIISYCQYALQRPEPELMRNAVERSLKNAERLSSLSSRILSMAAGDRPESLTLPLRPIIDDAIICLGRDLDKDSICLTVNVTEELTVRAHHASLQQVIFNIVLNARQAMLGKPGRLTISAKRDADGLVVIEFTDTGCGIKLDHQSKIFQPFFSTKSHDMSCDRSGIGLGLHVCKRLMMALGGDITVRSKPGEGTTFTVTVPADYVVEPV